MLQMVRCRALVFSFFNFVLPLYVCVYVVWGDACACMPRVSACVCGNMEHVFHGTQMEVRGQAWKLVFTWPGFEMVSFCCCYVCQASRLTEAQGFSFLHLHPDDHTGVLCLWTATQLAFCGPGDSNSGLLVHTSTFPTKLSLQPQLRILTILVAVC